MPENMLSSAQIRQEALKKTLNTSICADILLYDLVLQFGSRHKKTIHDIVFKMFRDGELYCEQTSGFVSIGAKTIAEAEELLYRK